MLCPVCRRRFAPFPEHDFKYRKEDSSYIPIGEGADKRREAVYNNDEEKVCSQMCMKKHKTRRDRAERVKRPNVYNAKPGGSI